MWANSKCNTSTVPSHCTWFWIHSSLSEFSFSLTPSFTCTKQKNTDVSHKSKRKIKNVSQRRESSIQTCWQSSSALSRASFKGPRSAWPSAVHSRIYTQIIARIYQQVHYSLIYKRKGHIWTTKKILLNPDNVHFWCAVGSVWSSAWVSGGS